jgi:hypothetical protein
VILEYIVNYKDGKNSFLLFNNIKKIELFLTSYIPLSEVLMYTYYSLKDKINSLKKDFNVDFKNFRSCHHQENSNIIAYKDINTTYIYIYDCFTNIWEEDKNDVYNYTMYGFENENYEMK